MEKRCIIRRELEIGMKNLCPVCAHHYAGACTTGQPPCKVTAEGIKNLEIFLKGDSGCDLKRWCKDASCTRKKIDIEY